ncbi:LOW QUALITY PROTEIN: hypothetical protein MKX08_010633 [Trichoderma sp. CBMAI-0020]|nr:LOW QUALITY PROTEIN: hypothetical protein MKX08_010633 [Trichoderma sp. CBMAI-0020]
MNAPAEVKIATKDGSQEEPKGRGLGGVFKGSTGSKSWCLVSIGLIEGQDNGDQRKGKGNASASSRVVRMQWRSRTQAGHDPVILAAQEPIIGKIEKTSSSRLCMAADLLGRPETFLAQLSL